MYPTSEKEGFRHRLHQRLNRFRNKSRVTRHENGTHSSRHIQENPTLATNPASIDRRESSAASPSHSSRASHVDESQLQIGHKTLHGDNIERSGTTSHLGTETGSLNASPDLWSAAFREAVESLGKEIDVIALKGKNITQLFRDLEDIEQRESRDSAFLRGVRVLQSLRVPLETFKLALDLASPLSNLEPTAATVVGVVRSVTAIAISFATADLDFAKRIGEMLRQISYIDDCDTLGQKSKRRDIHDALVSAYQKILEFYEAALEILNRQGTKFIIKTVLENDRLPNIVQDFLSCSDLLQKLIGNATHEIMGEITEMCYDREISTWLGGDKMSQQASLYNDFKVLRANETCGFLLKSENFIKWYHATGESQQLVILGEMGCGKSVAMAFLQHHLKQRNDHLPGPKVCGYYCRDDGTRKDIHVLSVLIQSLLYQLPGLKKQFVADYRQAQLDGNYDPAVDPEVLEELLQKMLDGIDRPIFFLIDGLDECDRLSRNNLLRVLRSLSQNISGFKSVISSRPKEDVLEQLGEAFRIEIVPNAERDTLIVEDAVEKKLSHLPTSVKALVIKELSSRACGSGIWTRMTVELIEARQISKLDPMQDLLEKLPLPTKLSKLYNTLLSQYSSNITENEYDAWTALKLLSICRRPLSILELTWAVTMNAARYVSTVSEIAKKIDCQRVMSLITPFINRVDFIDLKRHQVRLLHQSIKEFILEETSRQPFSRDLMIEESEGMLLNRRSQSLEAFMLGICSRYLLLDEISTEVLFSEEQLAIAELPQEIDLFNDSEKSVEYDPHCSWESWEEDMIRFDPTERGFGEFFVYASSHWLDHFGAITLEPLPSLACVENLCQAGSTRLYNWTQQNCRPGCTIIPRYQFDSILYDPLSITSLYGSEAMLHNMLENSDFDKETFLREPAMASADQILRWGDVTRLRIIFSDKRLGHQLQNFEFFRLIIKRWYEPSKRWKKSGINRQNWEILFDLIDCISDKLVREKWGKDLLCVALSAGCFPMTQRLLKAAHHTKGLQGEFLRGMEENFEDTTLYVAIRTGHISVIGFLVAAGANLKIRDQGGNTPLHLATESGCSDAVILLLNGSDKNAKNFAGRTALQIATERGNNDVERALQQWISLPS